MGDPATDAAFNTARERSRPELLWFLRHRDALERWPVLAEEWAGRIEARRRAEAGPSGRDGAPSHGRGG